MAVAQISAVTFAVADMARSVRFYRRCGFELLHGGEGADFTSFRAGGGFVNLMLRSGYTAQCWGRAIFHVQDVDAHHRELVAAGLRPEAPPADAPWGERFFHITDPDGHELSFAQPMTRRGDAAGPD